MKWAEEWDICACVRHTPQHGSQPPTLIQNSTSSWKGEPIPLIMPIVRWGRRQLGRHLKQIAPFREIWFLEMNTGTFPRLKVALNNQGTGGHRPCPLGRHHPGGRRRKTGARMNRPRPRAAVCSSLRSNPGNLGVHFSLRYSKKVGGKLQYRHELKG